MRTKIVLSLAALLALQYQLATQSKQVKPSEPVIVPPETGAQVGGLRGQGNWKLTKDQTGGSIAISESYAVNAATEFPPAHVHTREDELWYVMEGELKFQIGDRIAAAGPGTLVFAPRSVPHNYIVSKAPARWLLMLTPAGLDPLFPEVDELRKRLRPGTAEFRDKLEEMRAKYGVYNGEKWEGITSAEDPADGTWELDVRASKFNPGSSWRRQTQIYKADGRNIKMIATGINGRGRRIRSEYIGAYDGQDYPVTGGGKGETIAQLRIDYYTVKTTTKIGGKITGASARVISKDGTVMTITASGTDGKAVEFKDTLVFRKR